MSNISQTTEHNRLIVDQFTAMAAPFAKMPAHSEEASLRLLCEAAMVEPDDRVLDVCCGTGIVSLRWRLTPATSPASTSRRR